MDFYNIRLSQMAVSHDFKALGKNASSQDRWCNLSAGNSRFLSTLEVLKDKCVGELSQTSVSYPLYGVCGG